MEKEVYGYIRVSTVKQGEGASLDAQKDSIENYALKNRLKVIQWFEEKQTAAKHGRPIFSKMLDLLKKKKACGVIIHKIDRSARNLKDWVDIGELIDSGTEVHFSSEAIDFNSRGGRLYADIRAVISTDFIRNQIEEVKKGLYGRLKQGLYPFGAPIGYLDTGKGKVKKIDLKKAPLIKKLFTMYATGQYGIIFLGDLMFKLGLRNSKGNKVSRNGISTILNNPFYTGVMRIKKNGMVFEGKHEPIISKKLFDKVQLILQGKAQNMKVRHNYLFRRRIKCKLCNRSLIAEKQKKRIYYRCHIKECPTKTIREEYVQEAVLEFFDSIVVEDKLIEQTKQFFQTATNVELFNMKSVYRDINLKISAIESRQKVLEEKLLDQVIDDETFKKLQADCIVSKTDLKNQQRELKAEEGRKKENPYKFLELLKKLKQIYLLEDLDSQNEHKRELLNLLTSNFYYSDGKLSIQTNPVLYALSNMDEFVCCAQPRTQVRPISTSPDTVDYQVTNIKHGQFHVTKIKNKIKISLTELLGNNLTQCHNVTENLKSIYVSMNIEHDIGD